VKQEASKREQEIESERTQQISVDGNKHHNREKSRLRGCVFVHVRQKAGREKKKQLINYRLACVTQCETNEQKSNWKSIAK
jgi:hypothetical protein